MVKIEEKHILKIGDVLNDKNRPLKERFRALFTLKNLGGDLALKCIERGFFDDSVLLKHELAYCLGQMQNRNAISILKNVLEDVKQEAMVRHEAAEALGAIGVAEVKEILKKHLNDPVVEVSETCEIALERVKWFEQNKVENDENIYSSVDPAPPSDTKNINELKTILLNEDEKLFNRYRAMFSLRNIRTDESVLALSAGLKAKSALFRHEIAFILGQLQEPCSVPFLKENLQDLQENEMVRHECAEALGAIATDDCIKILNHYMNDNKRVVKESCEIALDMCEYENTPEFQYADTLVKCSK